MSSEDLQYEDIVLLQLFKDQIMNYNLDQVKASTERFPSQQGDLSEFDKILSEPKPCPGDWPENHPIARLAQAAQGQGNCSRQVDTGLPRDLPTHRRTIDVANTKKRSQRLGKDEKLAKEAGITFNVKQTLVSLPMDEFNDLLSKNDLTEEQLNICRDIRRRGKNKVAAQNCRQRKMEQIEELHGRLRRAADRRDRVRCEHNRLLALYASQAGRLKKLTEIVLGHHNKDDSNFSLQVDGDEVKILPKAEVKEEDIPQQIENFCMEENSFSQFSFLNNNLPTQESDTIYQRKQYNNNSTFF